MFTTKTDDVRAQLDRIEFTVRANLALTIAMARASGCTLPSQAHWQAVNQLIADAKNPSVTGLSGLR